MKRIFLIGYMGAGKTTVGKVLPGSWDSRLSIWTTNRRPLP